MRHQEAVVSLQALPDAVFAFVDDHARLSSHMNRSSWMLGGGQMRIDMDDKKGQAVGSHIRLSGRVFGFRLFLDEVVTRRNPPNEKVWETVGRPKLLVIGAYQMGMEIGAEPQGTRLRVLIDYDLPSGRIGRLLGLLFGGMYARWCVKQMIDGARAHFRSREPARSL